ncbi:ferric reductase domain-containing protein (plasmid) [Chondrocystis sp. NIES-4102]|nr:ferric reductase domain-containing protein [Chondrocystis sp. NIES-4102]
MTKTSESIKVLIVDDLLMICENLKDLFSKSNRQNIKVVGFAHNGRSAILETIKNEPDIVIIDILMPIMGGIEAIQEITERFPNIKTIAFSTFNDESLIKSAILAGAKGYILKDSKINELEVAIEAVYNNSFYLNANVSPSILAESPIIYKNQKDTTQVSKSYQTDNNHKQFSVIEKGKITSASNSKSMQKNNKDKPLFAYGDWLFLILFIGILSQTDGMGHDLGHAGLFLLIAALIARPIRFFWDFPLKNRRTIGIFAFAATSGHVIYATNNVLTKHLTPNDMTTMSLLGLIAGIISILMMTPAAITSFRYWQEKLGGKKWKQIHLLSVPALIFAVIHTILLGPHYMQDLQLELLNHLRIVLITLAGSITLLMRKKMFWSVIGLNKLRKNKNENT